MRLTRLAIARPVAILMLFAAIIVLGFRSRSSMTVDLFPNIDMPMVFILTVYEGAGPEEIETLVTKPIEDNVISVSGLKSLDSTSQEGVSIVRMEFEIGTDMITTMSDVRAKVDMAKMMLPDDVTAPLVQKLDVGSLPVLWLGLSSNRPARELREIADNTIKDELGRVPGVGAVNISGGDVREIEVNVHKDRLEAYGISISQIAQALASDNLNMPSGKITEGIKDYSIRAMGEFSVPDEIEDMKVSVLSTDGIPRIIRIGDVADVRDTVAERTTITRLQRKDSVGIMIQKQSDANTVGVVDGVKAAIERMKTILPPDISVAVSFDQSNMVNDAMADVNMSLILGALLAVIIVFMFLHNIRGTFIVAIAIPTSMIATFIPISFAGFTMNMMVMLGFSLSVGILVDDSIVVLENIYRHLTMGETPKDAAINGRTEIGLAAIAITMVDVVVFVPIAFMGGVVGMLFKEFGITVAVATLFSLFVSFTLTPMLASRWYKQHETFEYKKGFPKWFDDEYNKLRNFYKNVLNWSLIHRWYTLLIAGIVLGGIMLYAMPRIQSEFMPRIDSGRITVDVEMPVGTTLATTDAVISQIEERVQNIPELDNIFTTVGTTGGGLLGTSSNEGEVSVVLKEKESLMDSFLSIFSSKYRKRKRSDEMIAQEVRRLLRDIPGGRITVKLQSTVGGGMSPIDLEVTGQNVTELNNVSLDIRDTIAKVPGVINAEVSWKVGKPEIRVSVDRVKAANMGLSMAQIASALRTSIAGNTESKFRQNGNEYDIRVWLNDFDRNKLDDVRKIVVGSYNGMTVYLADVANIVDSTGPTIIERKNRQKKVSVTADLLPGHKLGTVESDIRKALSTVSLGNTQLNYGGQSEDMAESFGKLISALILSILLVYMLMAALFESLLHPFIIMLSVPLAMVGAIFGLVLTGDTMNIVSMIGIIMLIGLVTKNAILLVDFTNTLRSRGLEREAALLEAGPIRLRPILMTTFAMIFAMLPTALKLGRGAEIRAPMAIAVLGGLVVSTVLTLLIVPVMYTLIDDLMAWIYRKGRQLRSFFARKIGHQPPNNGGQPDPPTEGG